MKPCGHEPLKDGCRLCHLYATDERYRRLWDGTATASGECKYRGKDRVFVAGSNRDWRTCGHPTQPLGPIVCVCKGCGPKCSGFKVGPSEPVES